MMKRFIKEYANYKLKDINSNELMQQEIREEKIAEINKVIKYRKSGLITIDEVMNAISKI